MSNGIFMSTDDFVRECTACGGNWATMLLTGIAKVFPRDYSAVLAKVEEIGYAHGGIYAMEYVCDWLWEHGVRNPKEV